MSDNTSMGSMRHDHQHGANRFAVIPTPVRLDAAVEVTGRGVTIAFLDSGFYPHPDLTNPINRIIAYEDITQSGASLKADEPPQNWDWHGTQTSVTAAGNGYLIVRQGYGVINARCAVEQARREQHALDAAHFRPPRVEAGKLVFFHHDDRADNVSLAGDFNHWNPFAAPMVRDGSGVWQLEIEPPPPGRFRYKFVVNGERWAEDPSNGHQAFEPFPST